MYSFVDSKEESSVEMKQLFSGRYNLPNHWKITKKTTTAFVLCEARKVITQRKTRHYATQKRPKQNRQFTIMTFKEEFMSKITEITGSPEFKENTV